MPRRNERKIYDPQAKADRTDLNLAPFVSAGRICRAGMSGVSRLVYPDWQIAPFLAFLSSVFSPLELLYELPARRTLLSVLPWNLRRINYARFAPTRNNARRIDRCGNYQAIVHTLLASLDFRSSGPLFSRCSKNPAQRGRRIC